MLGITASITAILVFLAFADWRSAPILCVIAALLQDPLRKVTPEQPVYFVLLVGVVFAAACLGAWTQNVSFSPGQLFGRDRKITATMYTLLVIVALEALNSFLRFGNPMVTGIGLLMYLLPLPSVIFAYHLASRGGERRIHQFLLAYVILAGLALMTVYLEYYGNDLPVFGQVGGTLLIYDHSRGGLIVPHSGIFRASEIAAWHAMTCACFVIMLVTVRRFNFVSLFSAALLVMALIGLATLTGRRKAIIEVAVFASTYLTLWCVLQQKAEKIGIFLGVLAFVGFGWWVSLLGQDIPLSTDEGTTSYYNYVERSKTVFADAPSRVVELGIAPVMWAYERFGLFGAGVGTGTQGTQHFGRNDEIAGAAEGGLGKLTLELGIPGLLVSLWFAVLALGYLWRVMRHASEASPRIATLSYGLFSFLLANAAGFSVATQAYSDIFILLILGWAFGFLLAIPVLLKRNLPIGQLQTFGHSAPTLRQARL
jgi:hypothetical protein